jgi:hypothetical protein
MRTLALAVAIVGCLAMSGCAGTNDLARGEGRVHSVDVAAKVLSGMDRPVRRLPTLWWGISPR